ncbi:potassium channel family protein [Neolewinella aurantiaca]|uniref:potassium channel family protein n=1 Tax=Neolewinella aurantiaca TaxID=2602767 RepID=UPI001FE96261|nr:potassium channel protein [Neolewinella aurantiaca]
MGTIAVETLGLVFIEEYTLIDAFYMAVITISTVGFSEVQPLSEAGRLFMAFMIILNIGVFAYALATFSYYIIEGKIFELMERSYMQARVDSLKGHTIICGFGRYGREVARHLKEQGQPFVVIEENLEKLDIPEFEDFEVLYVDGDATHDEVLREAGIDRAVGLITSLNDDSDNLFIVLSAKELNPKLRIISSAHSIRSRQKLMRAGASNVILPEQIGGFYMATLISKPGAVEFFSYVTNELDSDIGFEEIRYDQLPDTMRGKTIMNMNLREISGVNVIGHRSGAGKYNVNPGPMAVLKPGESFIIVGSQPQILALRNALKI